MKALTLWMPWALLVATGKKRWETRKWYTKYRGPLVIHAANRWDPEWEELSLDEPFRSALGLNGKVDPRGELRAQMRELRGCALCVVRLARVKPTASARHELDAFELQFGDYTPQRWAFELTDLHRLAEPVRVRGAQGMWDLNPEILGDPRIAEVA